MSETSPQSSKVSVVVPSYNTVGMTLRCLESLHAQPEMNLECLVVDDASNDGTAEAVAARFPSVRLLRQSERSGFTASVNRGLDAAGGTILIALNSDTEVPRGSLEAVVARFGQSEKLGVAGARLSYPDGSAQWSGGTEPSLLWLFGLASGLPALLARVPGWRALRPVAGTAVPSRVDWVTGAALAMRREVWRSVGPFDPSYHFYAQDLDLCTRARSAGWKVEIVPAFRVVHHHGATIGREESSVAHQNPVLLWPDLVLWARRHRGESWAGRAALAFRLGGRLRLVGRRLRELGLADQARARWRRESDAYRQALRAVSRQATP